MIWLPHKYMRFLIFYVDILNIGGYWSNYFLYIPLLNFYGVFSHMRNYYKRVMDEYRKGDHALSAEEKDTYDKENKENLTDSKVNRSDWIRKSKRN
jgi:hypothetical protein